MSLDTSGGLATLNGVVPPDDVVLRAFDVGRAGVDAAVLFWLVLPLACDAVRWTMPNSSAGNLVVVGCGALLNAGDGTCSELYPLSG